MTTIATEPIVFSGFQKGRVYALNVYGRPDASVESPFVGPYTGMEIYATKTFSLTVPPTRKVAHIGNDQLKKVQQFPSQEPITGELGAGAEDLDLVALLTGATVITKAGAKGMVYGTDLQGSEPNVGFILSQDALAESGPQRIRNLFVTSTKAVPRSPGMGNEPIDFVFDLAPDPVNHHLWGELLSILSDPSDPFSGVSESGALTKAFEVFFSAYELVIASFIAQTDQVLFSFKDNEQAINAVDMEVFVGDGPDVVEVTAGITKAVGSVTFDTAPVTTYGAGAEVHVLYQLA